MFSSTLVKSIQVNGVVTGEGTKEQAIAELKGTLFALGVSQEIERYGFYPTEAIAKEIVENKTTEVIITFSN